ncbi:unnamed protein product [Lathyrus oleraceus]|uniref:F-box domain-containing protein n=3 Tax=Pisum sativum TaxID=3888 RepID=A0A9D5B207_PEA|nr:F-box/FBD/LRR-repeat protein At1g13570-like isoform X1 [Pisum sativum]KAI5427175.1 hypothetical protein KIW84_032555 [Pisum sativum]
MMTLFNKKANQNDRISDLPSNVIDGILGNLRIRDQVRTSILSKKWRYMWTSASQLCFDEHFFESFILLDDDPEPVVSKIITDVLMIRNGPIHKFSICVSADCEFDISTEKLNMWIPFMSRNLTHLKLLNYCTPPDENHMPDILFSCKELTYFKFSSFNLSIPPNFRGFEKLLELHLECVEFDSSALENFMSGCPVLEKLNIGFRLGSNRLVISSPSLKVLVLELHNTKLVCLRKAKNLSDFTLKAFHGRGYIRSSPKIKRFSLTNWGKNSYEDIIHPMLLSRSFSSLEYLKLDDLNLNDKGDILYLVRVLESAPSLIDLVIKQSYKDIDTTKELYRSKELECPRILLQLQTVDVHFRANSQYTTSLIRFILANSPLLKTLTFYCSYNDLGAPMMLNFSKDLLWMERASPKAQVNFRHV